jgi:hypothetical protein
MSTHRCFAILFIHPVAATAGSTEDAGGSDGGYYVEINADE